MDANLFCPRCGAQNKMEQKFCRQCGLALPAVRLALEGRVAEAAADLKEAEDRLGGGIGTLGIFILAALVNFFLWDWGVLINLVLGLLITSRWLYRGLTQIERIRQLLDSKEQAPASPALPQSPEAAALPPVPDTDPLVVAPPTSVAEHTTFTLKQPEPRPK